MSQIFQPLFNPEPPHVPRTFRPSESAAAPDMTSPAAFDRHLLKFDKRPKMPPPMAFVRILVARRFACPTNCGHLVLFAENQNYGAHRLTSNEYLALRQEWDRLMNRGSEERGWLDANTVSE